MINNIYLWSGCGYGLTAFAVPEPCESLEFAIEQVVASLIAENETDFFEEVDSDYIEMLHSEQGTDHEFDPEGWLYVDATMEGAPRPVYLRSENMKWN